MLGTCTSKERQTVLKFLKKKKISMVLLRGRFQKNYANYLS